MSTALKKGDVLVARKWCYEVRGLRGTGGMGSVYICVDPRVPAAGNTIAIKVMDPALAKSDPSTCKNFLREANLTIVLKHRNIVQGLWVDTSEDGLPLLAMEELNGESVRELVERKLARRERIQPVKAASIAIDVLRALHVAHKHGAIHQDIKTSNVVIHKPFDEAPLSKLIDFGVSRLAEDRSRALAGTLYYAAPEQLTGGEITPCTDVYGVGGLLYEMLSCERPFPYSGTMAGALARVDQRPAPLKLDMTRPANRDLAAVVERALSPKPSDRFASAKEMANALTSILSDLVTAPQKKVAYSDVARPIRGTDLAAPAAPPVAAPTSPANPAFLDQQAAVRAATPEPVEVGNSVTQPASAAAAQLTAITVREGGRGRPAAGAAPTVRTIGFDAPTRPSTPAVADSDADGRANTRPAPEPRPSTPRNAQAHTLKSGTGDERDRGAHTAPLGPIGPVIAPVPERGALAMTAAPTIPPKQRHTEGVPQPPPSYVDSKLRPVPTVVASASPLMQLQPFLTSNVPVGHGSAGPVRAQVIAGPQSSAAQATAVAVAQRRSAADNDTVFSATPRRPSVDAGSASGVVMRAPQPVAIPRRELAAPPTPPRGRPQEERWSRRFYSHSDVILTIVLSSTIVAVLLTALRVHLGVWPWNYERRAPASVSAPAGGSSR